MIVLLPDYDRKLAEKDIELAEANKESGYRMIFINCQGQTPYSGPKGRPLIPGPMQKIA